MSDTKPPPDDTNNQYDPWSPHTGADVVVRYTSPLNEKMAAYGTVHGYQALNSRGTIGVRTSHQTVSWIDLGRVYEIEVYAEEEQP